MSEATFWRMEAERSGSGLRDTVRAMDHDELVALIMALCSGAWPRAVRDSVLAEINERTGPVTEAPSA